MLECQEKVSPASAFLLVVSPASAFRYQGQSGTDGHGLVRHCPALLVIVINRWSSILLRVMVTWLPLQRQNKLYRLHPYHYRGIQKLYQLLCYRYWGSKKIVSIRSLLLLKQKKCIGYIVTVTAGAAATVVESTVMAATKAAAKGAAEKEYDPQEQQTKEQQPQKEQPWKQ